MKLFIKNLTRFVLILLVAYPILIFLAGSIFPDVIKKNLLYTRGGNGFTYQRLQEAQLLEHVDLLFIGSSRSYRGFDTRIFSDSGFTCFNLGTSNQTPIQSLYLLKKHIPRLKPKKVVMEVNPDLFSIDGVESALDLISNESHFTNQIYWLRVYPDIKIFNTILYASLASFLPDKTYPLIKGDQHYIKGGYVYSDHKTFNNSDGNSYQCDVLPQQKEAFEEIITLLKTYQIPVVLIQSPIDQMLYKQCPPKKNFEDLMKKYTHYFNFNERSIPYERSLLLDKQHLNQKGVNVFNQEVLKILSNR